MDVVLRNLKAKSKFHILSYFIGPLLMLVLMPVFMLALVLLLACAGFGAFHFVAGDMLISANKR
jgi:hypothetical protein